MATTGELKKMLIEAFNQADYSGEPAESFEVMFNPNSYSQKYEVEYHDRQGAGDTGSPQIFGKVKPQEYAFEFLFDGTGAAAEKADVHERVETFLKVTGKHDGDIHRPMYLKLSWGTLLSKCVLKSAEVTYVLFEPDGHPLRAKVKATFSENVEDTLRVAEERKSSPDLTHVHVVQAGEHLSLLAHRYYGDASRYYQVARHNSLTNYRRLAPGQRLEFPPIGEASGRTGG
jgi:LysM repeat protein